MPDEKPKTPEVMPRTSLREPAFRLFEPFLLKAVTTASFIVQSFEFPGRMTAACTFINNFSDAKRGLALYKYKTDSALQTYPTKWFTAKELTDGNVLIENRLLVAKPTPVKIIPHL